MKFINKTYRKVVVGLAIEKATYDMSCIMISQSFTCCSDCCKGRCGLPSGRLTSILMEYRLTARNLYLALWLRIICSGKLCTNKRERRMRLTKYFFFQCVAFVAMFFLSSAIKQPAWQSLRTCRATISSGAWRAGLGVSKNGRHSLFRKPISKTRKMTAMCLPKKHHLETWNIQIFARYIRNESKRMIYWIP